ncbi:hypothetical protein MBLNU230_g0518t1 [Neophaeotheca triangularis]
MISAVILVIICIFLPPVTVFALAGCGADLLINILLCILAVFPGHIHGFYIMYVYYKRQEDAERGILDDRPAPLVFSDKVNRGGLSPRKLRERQESHQAQHAPQPQPHPQQQMGGPGYGTMGEGQMPPPQQGYHAQQQGFAPPPQYEGQK